jgi:hypothetical protein
LEGLDSDEEVLAGGAFEEEAPESEVPFFSSLSPFFRASEG